MNDFREQDMKFIRRCIELAGKAAEKGETPVGAVVVKNTTAGPRTLSEAHNLRETLHDPSAHAEMLAVRAAAEKLGTWRLDGCTLYVSLEPCAMCTGVAVLARLDRIVFGAYDPKGGACGSVLNIPATPELNHHPEVTGGVLAEEAGRPLVEFFRRRRGKKQDRR